MRRSTGVHSMRPPISNPDLVHEAKHRMRHCTMSADTDAPCKLVTWTRGHSSQLSRHAACTGVTIEDELAPHSSCLLTFCAIFMAEPAFWPRVLQPR